MRAYTVYRVNSRTQKAERIGTVVDNCDKDPSVRHLEDLLKSARRKYALSPRDPHVFIFDEILPLDGVTILEDEASSA